ncbi:putative powdery mildew resistance protein, RPW8 [Rosa chinensis]|uniref:Putative powdery mildew resistance protein, RPW8 n=1 Tax=Rosa chinensis TaxID=74649 RepID=A0A2P6REY1_ROSCH|nr:probable disease resistance protein At5g66900 [Rosa chinensis]PRQ44990.1 putative powdery mildew resistance protein, RPW8 [Rosa chinensis]
MAEAAEPVMGTAISYNALYEEVNDMMAKNLIFQPLLKDLKSKLDTLQVFFQDMARYKHSHPQKEELEACRTQIEQGRTVIHKCSHVSKWNMYKKNKYTNQLLGLIKSLERLSEILKGTQVEMDVKESLVAIRNIETMFETKALSTIPELPSFVVGFDVHLSELKIKLLSNDEASMLVLTGMGGCGKTLLATLFCQDDAVKDKFKDNIFFVTVSRNLNFEHIVQQLYQQKRSPVPALEQKRSPVPALEQKRSPVPTFQSKTMAVTCLQQFLKAEGNKPLLLVLDDVWSGSESLLEVVDELKMPNYKILITSRSSFPRFSSPYYMEPLNYENAMTLFHHSASLGDKSSYIPHTLSRKVLEQCKGIPLVITAIGRSLCAQPVEMWKRRVSELSKNHSVLEYETEVFLCLKSSLDALDEMPILKKCFFDLASFPSNRRIPVAALIDMWIELYDLEEEILCIGNIYDLTTRSLANVVVPRKLEEKEGDGYYIDYFVTQHDFLRDLAICHCKRESIQHGEKLFIDLHGNNLPKWWREQKYQSIEARLASISTDESFSMAWPYMHLPEAEVLILNFDTNNYALPEFVEGMVELKVLVVTNYGSLPVELRNFQLLSSLPKLKRIRLERISIASITNIPIELKRVQKISLFMCGIGQAFSNCPIKISDAFPNLEEMNIDYCNDLVELPTELCDLVHLKRLCITNCHKLSALPVEIGKLINLEVLRLRSCKNLEGLPCSIKNLGKLNFLDIAECSRLQELPESVLALEQLKEVICDEDMEGQWTITQPNIRIKVLKEEVNQNWLSLMKDALNVGQC